MSPPIDPADDRRPETVSEQELRRMVAESARMAAIVESSDDAIISKDLDGIVTSWNPAAEKIFGYSAAEMVGASIMRLIPDDRQHEERNMLQAIRSGERVQHLETVRRTKAGALITISVTTSPIKDPAGRIIGASKVARDITAQKRAEEELNFQRTMLLTERELTIDGILVVDENSKVLSYNRRFAEMWGISNDILATRADEQLLGAVAGTLLDPDKFMDRVRELYDRHDESSQDEVELRDGRTFDRYSAPMRDADGRYHGRVWYFRDVTERKLTEAELRYERDRAQRYLDTADVILLALDAGGRIKSINRKGCDVLGWSEAELLGRTWVETCVPARVRDSLTEKLDGLLRGTLSEKGVSVIENWIVTKTGEERLIEWRNRLLRTDNGRVTGTFSSGTDITERHKAVEALSATEARMRFALESAGVGIWDQDLVTGKGQMSAILECHYGLKPGEFGGTFEAFMAGIHPDDRTAMLDAVGKAMKTGADFSTLHRALWRDGTIRWLSSAGRYHLGLNGEPVRGVGISIDVTDRHTLEEQYHQAQKMEAVGRLAGGVAHDFNNLLTAILGYCQLLLGDLDPQDPRAKDIGEIAKAGESAAGLTRQLLAFSRKQIIEPTLLDLNVVVGNMRSLLARVIGEDLEVTMTLRPGLGMVLADAGQMEQIVLNLAVNARDAMPNGGQLTIETANIELDETYASTHFSVKSGPYVKLTVTDTGVGMPDAVKARLFEPFFTTKELGKGTGLGLATVHGIVMRSGGSVGVYSEVGKGSAFTVYLPRATEAAAQASTEAPTAPAARSAGETVLVVEDADALRVLAKRILERQGYKVLVAANATEAVELFEKNPSIDVILSDVIMPGGSGPELTARLVAQRPNVKVLYMSGYTEDAITHHGVLKAGVAFLHKPFTPQTLGKKLREVLGR